MLWKLPSICGIVKAVHIPLINYFPVNIKVILNHCCIYIYCLWIGTAFNMPNTFAMLQYAANICTSLSLWSISFVSFISTNRPSHLGKCFSIRTRNDQNGHFWSVKLKLKIVIGNFCDVLGKLMDELLIVIIFVEHCCL